MTTLKSRKPSLSEKRSKAGHIGGLQTFFLHGREGMSEKGRLGGRPRLITLEEIQESRRLEAETEKENRRMDTPHSNSLATLKTLWRNKRAGLDC